MPAIMKSRPETILLEAKSWLERHKQKGAVCPCCGQYAKVYPRKLHSEMAAFLCRLVRAYQQEPRWYHIREIRPSKVAKASTDGAYLKHWGLLESRDAKPDGTKGGSYKPTELGVKFALGRARVRSHVYLYDNEVCGWSDETVDIDDALASKFSRAELMA